MTRDVIKRFELRLMFHLIHLWKNSDLDVKNSYAGGFTQAWIMDGVEWSIEHIHTDFYGCKKFHDVSSFLMCSNSPAYSMLMRSDVFPIVLMINCEYSMIFFDFLDSWLVRAQTTHQYTCIHNMSLHIISIQHISVKIFGLSVHVAQTDVTWCDHRQHRLSTIPNKQPTCVMLRILSGCWQKLAKGCTMCTFKKCYTRSPGLQSVHQICKKGIQ